MKKLILSAFLFIIGWSAMAQLRYHENAKIYVDAGLQLTYEGGIKIAAGTRINQKLAIGLGIEKSLSSGITSLGVEAKLNFRKPDKLVGLLLHGGYYTAVVSDYYTSLVYPEFGIGVSIDNFSITAGLRQFVAKEQWGNYSEPNFMIQTMYNFGATNPDIRNRRQKEAGSTYFEDKKVRQEERLKSPIYFEVALGPAFLNGNVRSMYRRTEFYYNISVGWQKTPWKGFGVSYSSYGDPGYEGLKALGLSWRARPRLGYFKATVNVLNEFEYYSYDYSNRVSIRKEYRKKLIPPNLSLEAGVRCWDMLLLKVGYLVHTPFDMEVTTESFSDFSSGPTRVTATERVNLGYFHMGIGFIL